MAHNFFSNGRWLMIQAEEVETNLRSTKSLLVRAQAVEPEAETSAGFRRKTCESLATTQPIRHEILVTKSFSQRSSLRSDLKQDLALLETENVSGDFTRDPYRGLFRPVCVSTDSADFQVFNVHLNASDASKR
jgi:hypothetical protein